MGLRSPRVRIDDSAVTIRRGGAEVRIAPDQVVDRGLYALRVEDEDVVDAQPAKAWDERGPFVYVYLVFTEAIRSGLSSRQKRLLRWFNPPPWCDWASVVVALDEELTQTRLSKWMTAFGFSPEDIDIAVGQLK